MKHAQVFKDYEASEFDDGRWTRQVFRRGSGPAVIIIHEIPGLHPQVIEFADRVAAAGMTVFLPSLFGEPGKPVSIGYALGQIAMNICCAGNSTSGPTANRARSSTGCGRWPARLTPSAAVLAWARSACASPAASRWP